MAVDEAPQRSAPRALLLGLALTAGFLGIELVTGMVAGSLALVSDAGHMLADAAGLLLALAASMLGRRGPDARRTYGYARVEVLMVPVNVALLVGIAGYIVYESVDRLQSEQAIDTVPVMVVAAAGLIVNLVVVRLLHDHSAHDLNVKAAALDAIADALGSVLVLASAVFIALGGWQGADAIAGLAIAVFILPRAWTLFWQASVILLESAPPGLDPDAIAAASRDVPGVIELHDVHVWSIAPRFPALSAHVELADVNCTEHILGDLSRLLRDEFGIQHVTLQPETPAIHEAIACCSNPDSALLATAGHIHHERVI